MRPSALAPTLFAAASLLLAGPAFAVGLAGSAPPLGLPDAAPPAGLPDAAPPPLDLPDTGRPDGAGRPEGAGAPDTAAQIPDGAGAMPEVPVVFERSDDGISLTIDHPTQGAGFLSVSVMHGGGRAIVEIDGPGRPQPPETPESPELPELPGLPELPELPEVTDGVVRLASGSEFATFAVPEPGSALLLALGLAGAALHRRR